MLSWCLLLLSSPNQSRDAAGNDPPERSSSRAMNDAICARSTVSLGPYDDDVLPFATCQCTAQSIAASCTLNCGTSGNPSSWICPSGQESSVARGCAVGAA
jgi:hypothetical protein